MLFDNYTLRTVALGTAALGALSGALGTFAVLRRQSLLGDAVSHAALPGVALAFALTHSKAPLVLAAGAAVAGWLGTLAVLAIVRRSRVPYDSALGIVLSVFFGFGIVLLTWLQKRPDAAQAGLERYLFGQAATLLDSDVRALAGLGAVALAVLLALWKEFKLLAFDPDYAATLGQPVRLLDTLLTGLLVLAVVLGLQCVGVVLMSALVVAPAAAARQWSDRLSVVVLLAAAFGGLSGLGGTLAGDALSAPGKPLPTGPAVVLVATCIVLASLTKKLLITRVASP
ncbi:MAG: iron chelate uptake ABC transporter family permease subunit [Gemmataceae bacterium]